MRFAFWALSVTGKRGSIMNDGEAEEDKQKTECDGSGSSQTARLDPTAI